MIKKVELTIPVDKIKDSGYCKVLASKTAGIPLKEIRDVVFLRRSLDARRGNVVYKVQTEIYCGDAKYETPQYRSEYQNVVDKPPVVVVGAGPAGLFAALKLLEKGLKPIIVERGKDVHNRKYDIAKLVRENVVNVNSNYCFGEGGAGTFSDGKLYTRSTKRGNVRDVLAALVEHGADDDILVDAHPHIGTDKLPSIIENIRKTILDCGGEYYFDKKVVDLLVRNCECRGVVTESGDVYEGVAVILAAGHSSRDIFYMLHEKGVELQAKGFAMGVRLEHPQSVIDDIQYHNLNKSMKLPTASYNVVTQVDNRGVFSFCMCPGGIIVPASTDVNELVVNGMSNSYRNSPYANSGLVVQIEHEDLPDYHKFGVLACLKFQEDVERYFFNFNNDGNHNSKPLAAPAQKMCDFVKGKVSVTLNKSSYAPGVYAAPLDKLLPDFIAERMKKAFLIFGEKMRGFYTNQAMLIGLESRTSSPVRVVRNSDTFESVSLKRLFPCGEGAGFSGGIVSSAIDGVNVAVKIAELFL